MPVDRSPKRSETAEARIAELVEARGPGRTICPSEVARSLAGEGDFRPLMPLVREAAATLAQRGELVATQQGRPVDVRSVRGPIRLGLPHPQ
jgi:hypothetical protein